MRQMSLVEETNNLRLVFCSAILIGFSSANAEVHRTAGEFLFTTATSEERACDLAEQKAKENAIRLTRGETISSDEQLSCKERAGQVDNEQCVLNQIVWSRLDGHIRSSKVVNTFVVNFQGMPGVKKCRVEIEAVVSTSKLEADPSFDYRVELNQTLFKPGERLEIKITPAKKIHLAIFSWIPSDKKLLVNKIYPNIFDQSALIDKPRLIPDPKTKMYDFEVALPNNLSTDFSDEYLLFVATKNPVAWLSSYTIENLNERLFEIPAMEKRVYRRAYRVVRPARLN